MEPLHEHLKSSTCTFSEFIVFCGLVIVLLSWIVNAQKLASCDFEPNYRCEIIHGTGLIVIPTSVLTVWFSDDGSGNKTRDGND